VGGHCRDMKTYSLLRSKYLFGATIGLAVALSTGLRAAQLDPVPPARSDKVELKGAEKNFAEKVAKASMSEVEISRVAAERSSNPRVREFAEQMIADHSRLNDELATLAANRGITLPAKDNVADKWMKQNAKGFDRDYLKRMVSDHEDTVKLFQKQATEGVNPDLVAFARKHLDAIQHHLEQAKDLERFLK
jgi:putative membrane protein